VAFRYVIYRVISADNIEELTDNSEQYYSMTIWAFDSWGPIA